MATYTRRPFRPVRRRWFLRYKGRAIPLAWLAWLGALALGLRFYLEAVTGR
jgi:hypothetical protein